MSEQKHSGPPTPWARDRCEVCNRVIGQRPDRRKRRCGDHVQDLAVLPASVCKRKRRGAGGR